MAFRKMSSSESRLWLRRRSCTSARRRLVELADFDAFGEDKFHAALRSGGGLAAKRFDGADESCRHAAAGFEFQEAAIGAALFFQVAEGGDVAVLQNEDFVAALLDVAQEVRGEDDVEVAAIADFLNEVRSCAGARADRGRWWARRGRAAWGRARWPGPAWRPASCRASKCPACGSGLRRGRHRRRLRARVPAPAPAGSPESSAMRRTKRTPVIEAMKESFSGM